jgi:hypothetical protein
MTIRQFFCPHVHHRRERDVSGRLQLVCSDCGQPHTWKQVQSGSQAGQLQAMTVPAKRVGNVTPMRRAK